MFRELGRDIREMWQCMTNFERPLLVLFVPIYCVAFVLAYAFGEE